MEREEKERRHFYYGTKIYEIIHVFKVRVLTILRNACNLDTINQL